jgi:hypothetical protein
MSGRVITRTPRSLWWREVLYIALFYGVYSTIRNLFGSAQVSPATALGNTYRLIDWERSLFLYHEPSIQRAFLHAPWFLKVWNVYYGSFHFVVTGGVLIWLFLKADELRYRQWRNTLAAMTGLALIGFALFPLMPPRLLPDCGPFGGCVTAPFVDTMARYGGLWSFRSGPMEAISNQYAAMPSLHIGWSLWCVTPFLDRDRSWVRNGLLFAYPAVTLFAIVVTGNHFVLDAAGGALAFGVGRYLSLRLTRARSGRWPGLGRLRLAGAAGSRTAEAGVAGTLPGSAVPATRDSAAVGWRDQGASETVGYG